MLVNQIWSLYLVNLNKLLDHKLTLENHFLYIVQNVNQKTYALARILKHMPQKQLRITLKAFSNMKAVRYGLQTIFYMAPKI